ncbi:hypothetical protein NKH18_46430 [Streptomyces sp. M10(2022)]
MRRGDRGAGRASRRPAGRTLDVLALQATAFRPGALVLREPERLLVLLPAAVGRERDVLALARELDRLAVSLPGGVPVRAGRARGPFRPGSCRLVRGGGTRPAGAA